MKLIPVSDNTEDTEIVESAIFELYRNLGYEAIDVAIEGCIVNARITASGPCSNPDTIVSRSFAINLRTEQARTDYVSPRRDGEMWHAWVAFRSLPDSQQRSDKMNRYKEELLSDARRAVGGGVDADVSATSEFLRQYPLEDTSSWTGVTYCDGRIGLTPNAPNLILRAEKPQAVLAAVDRIAKKCST
jgi:hypothetical protein